MEGAVKRRENHPVDREKLVEVLSDQYQAVDPEFFSNSVNQPVAATIMALKRAHTFTVTTGHQLNIPGGPLFYFYKIASTIHLANQLQEYFPDCHFVPVDWMGSEDHDFEEINNVHLSGEAYTWEKTDDGPVGQLNPEPLNRVVETIKEDIREKETFEPLAELWEYAFTSMPERFPNVGLAALI
jgi:uncharacterized protein YllA (UPF0747 family)